MRTLPLIALMILIPFHLTAQECLDCHDDAVDMKRYDMSVHGKQKTTCEDCHSGLELTDDGHGPVSNVNCTECHEGITEVLDHSIHGFSKHAPPVRCKDCHGAHYILSEVSGIGRDFRISLNEMCGGCHVHNEAYNFSDENRKFVKSYFTSVHNATIQNSGLIFSATCVDCHGSHLIEPDESPECSEHSKTARQHISNTCGKCHKGSLREYTMSIHGQSFLSGNVDAPVCTDCHEAHMILNHYEKSSMTYPVNIPHTCLRCHSDPLYIKKYGFSPLKQTNYGDSFHGVALKLGDTSVATCVSCHGKHKILSQDNPESSVSNEQLGETCATCHLKDNPVDIGSFGKIHAMTAHQYHPISKWAALIYKVIIGVTLGFFGFYMSIDLFRTFRNKRKKKH